MPPPEVRVIGVQEMPEIQPGQDIAGLLMDASQRQGTPVEAGVISYRVDRCKFKYEVPFSQAAEPSRSDLGRKTARAESGASKKAAGRV